MRRNSSTKRADLHSFLKDGDVTTSSSPGAGIEHLVQVPTPANEEAIIKLIQSKIIKSLKDIEVGVDVRVFREPVAITKEKAGEYLSLIGGVAVEYVPVKEWFVRGPDVAREKMDFRKEEVTCVLTVDSTAETAEEVLKDVRGRCHFGRTVVLDVGYDQRLRNRVYQVEGARYEGDALKLDPSALCHILGSD